MKNLIKLSLVAVLGMLCMQSNAQIGVKGGFNLSNLLEKDDDATYSEDYKWLPGFHAGVTLGLPFSEYFAVEPGVLFTTKGMKLDEEFDLEIDGVTYTASLTGKASAYYIDVPVNLKLSYPLTEDFKIFAAAGPYAGYGLSGKLKSTLEIEGEEETDEEDIQWGDTEDDDLMRFDYGLTFGAGFIFNFIQLGASFDLGLANISPVTDNGAMTKNRVLKFSLGLMFGE